MNAFRMLSLALVLSWCGPTHANENKQDQLNNLWQQWAQTQVMDRGGPRFKYFSWRYLEQQQLLKQILNIAPKGSLDAFRAQVELERPPGNQQLDLDSTRRVRAMIKDLLVQSKKEPCPADLVRRFGILINLRREARAGFTPANNVKDPLAVAMRAFLKTRHQAGGDDAAEAGFWLLNISDESHAPAHMKFLEDEIAKKYPNSVFGKYAQLLLLHRQYNKKSALELRKIADAQGKTPLAYLALSLAGNAEPHTGLRHYVQRAKLFPAVIDTFPLPGHQRAWIMLNSQSRIGVVNPEETLKQTEALLTSMSGVNVHQVVMRAIGSGKSAGMLLPSAKKLNQLFDNVKANINAKRAASLEQTRLFALWDLSLYHPDNSTEPLQEACEKVVKAYPKSPAADTALDILALIHLGKKNHAQALSCWKKIIELQPENPRNSIYQFEIARHHQDPAEQQKHYQTILHDAKANPLVRCLAGHRLAIIFAKRHELSNAYLAHKKMLEIWPKNIQFLHLFVDDRWLTNDSSCLSDFRLDRQFVDDWAKMGQPFAKGDFSDLVLWCKIKDPASKDDRLKLLSTLCEKYPQSPINDLAQIEWAIQYEVNKQPKKAMAIYRKILSAKPSPIQALLARLGLLRVGTHFEVSPPKLDKDQQQKADGWIADLSSKEFKTRTNAGRELKKLGPAGLDYIRAKVKKPSPELSALLVEIAKSTNANNIWRAMQLYRAENKALDQDQEIGDLAKVVRKLGWKTAASLPKTSAKDPRDLWWLVENTIHVDYPDGTQGTLPNSIFDQADGKIFRMSRADQLRLLAFLGHDIPVQFLSRFSSDVLAVQPHRLVDLANLKTLARPGIQHFARDYFSNLAFSSDGRTKHHLLGDGPRWPEITFVLQRISLLDDHTGCFYFCSNANAMDRRAGFLKVQGTWMLDRDANGRPVKKENSNEKK